MCEDIRKMIDKVNNFKSLVSERYEISNMPNNIVLLSILKNDSTNFMLFNTLSKKAIGTISFGLYPKINSFTVYGAYSERGYGAFLYECSMTFVYPNGLSMSRDSTTSDDALNVWRKFETRNDVRKERIYSNEITHKKEDWLEGDFLSDNPEYRQKIFDLEDTRFYYSFGKEKLNNLIEVGKKYMNDNDISEQDVEYMSWDLEK